MGEKGRKDQGGKGLKGGKGGVAGGKGPAAGCWHCGGNHYMSECPRGGGKAFQLSEWFPPEWSGETTELAKSVVAVERVPREGQGGARGRQSSREDVQCRPQVLPTPTPTHVVSSPRESTPSQPQKTTGCSTLCQHGCRHNMGGPQQSTLGDWMVVTKKKGKRQTATMAMLNPIVAIEPQSVNGVTEDDEWEEV